jgi:predicted glycosyltransferase
MKKIWIDLDNSPHVLFFNPIIKELKAREIEVAITSRNYAQVTDLADLFGIDHKRIGKHYGKNKLMKIFGLGIRTLQMIPFYLKEKPNLVLSHGSRAMHIVATIFKIPIIGATDYEFTQHLPFVKKRAMILPEVIPDEATKGFAEEIIRYPGIKEDVYVPEFEPDIHSLDSLKLIEDDIVISIRPPATAAHYHTEKSDVLFNEVINHLMDNKNTKAIILSRTSTQEEEIKAKYKHFIDGGQIIIPDKVFNGLDLIWHSDLVISGGGTMIREAAALDVPAYSIFGGEKGAVDRYLEESGRLILISQIDDVRSKIILKKRTKPEKFDPGSRKTLNKIVDEIEKILNE